MAKYIDADLLIRKIKGQIRLEIQNFAALGSGRRKFCINMLEWVLKQIDSLQQEQPEESIAKEAVQLVFEEKLTPFKDGNQWSFLLGHNIQEGICGFGDTILDAAINFYKDYSTTRIHIGELKKTMEQPEVDLAKEIYSEWKKCSPIDEGMGVESAYIHIEAFDDITRHFYELGKASKGVTLGKTLDEAAEEYEIEHTYQRYDGGGLTPEYDATLAEAFEAGAKWMAGQGVSWEDKMTYFDGFLLYGKDERAFTMEGNFNEGDKVIVQIRKKEESK